MLGEIHDALHAVNMSLEAYYPAFRNLTVGGVVSTGAYGSSLNRSSALADSIVALDLVDGKGNLLSLSGNDTRLAAARTSFGALGVIVRLTLSIIPQFKIHMQVITLPDSVMQQPDFIDLIRNGTYVSYGWYPRAKVIIVEHGQQVSPNAPGDGKAITFNADPDFIELFSAINQLLIKNPELGPTFETLIADSQKKRPNYAYPDQKPSTDVTGWSHHIMCGTCSTGCPWFYGLRSKEVAYIFPLSVLPNLVRDITTLLDKEEHKLLSFPLGGIYFRFGKPTTALLGFGRHVEWFVPELTTWRSNDDGPIYDEAGLDAIEAIMRDQYKGIPHWGKNENATFTRAQHFDEKYGTDWQTFWDIQKQIDPDRVFLSPFISNFSN